MAAAALQELLKPGIGPNGSQLLQQLLPALELPLEIVQNDLTGETHDDDLARLIDARYRNAHPELAAEFESLMDGLDVPEFVRDFLRSAWPQVVAESRLNVLDGTADPQGYRAVVDDLIWSVQKRTARRGRTARLAKMIPGLVGRLREGLDRCGYPQAQTAHFFQGLAALHQAALQAGRDAAAQAAADAAEAEPSRFSDSGLHSVDPWLAGREAQESCYVDGDSVMPQESVAQPPQPAADTAAEGAPSGSFMPAPGAWVELQVGGRWLRVQLTWASPHATLFMFTSPSGTAHSMSRRTLERLHAQGQIRVVAGRHVVDEALDEVARAAEVTAVRVGYIAVRNALRKSAAELRVRERQRAQGDDAGGHPGLQLLLREAVAGLAGAGDIQQGAAHLVIAHLDGALPHVGHVAVRAGDAAARVDALAPQLELGVLRLQHLSAGLGVLEVVEAVPVGELLAVPEGLDLLGAGLCAAHTVGARLQLGGQHGGLLFGGGAALLCLGQCGA